MLRPGLSNDQIDEVMLPTGLSLPDEARALWLWADGVDVPKSDVTLGGHVFPGGLEMRDLSEAVAWHLKHVRSFPWSDTPDGLHSPSWFAAFGAGQDDYWLDTSVATEAPCPLRRIYRADMWTAEMLEEQTAESLTAAFNAMRSAVVSGAWKLIDAKAPAGSAQDRLLFWGAPNDARLPRWM